MIHQRMAGSEKGSRWYSALTPSTGRQPRLRHFRPNSLQRLAGAYHAVVPPGSSNASSLQAGVLSAIY